MAITGVSNAIFVQNLPQDRLEEAAAIDKNEDNLIEDAEILEYLKESYVLADGRETDTDRLLKEFKAHLNKEIPAEAEQYHTYDEVAAELLALAEAHPNLCQRVSLGQSYEGREIWALKISKNVDSEDTSTRPGIVLTGCHHAREWMSMEAPLYVAHQLVEGYATDDNIKRRVDSAEIWVVPLVNPDGYEYSRTQDNWWRKNRRPATNVFCDTQNPTMGMGVDLNRNYADGNAANGWIYRPADDAPCSTSDDHGATSDNPTSDTYRGPYGASELETQALLNLELNHPNIKGIIDHHGYGRMILYPWGNINDPVDNVETYRDIGNAMNDSLGDMRFRLMQSIELYPTSGGSHDIHHANGIISFTLEIGTSFQPDESQIRPIRERVGRANMTFIDKILALQETT